MVVMIAWPNARDERHRDHPYTTYLGSMTTDVSFTKLGTNTGTVGFVVHTPKQPVRVGGIVTGPMTMTTCP